MKKLTQLISWLRRKSPRMLLPNILANVLIVLVAVIAPHQAPVLAYKLGAVASGGCMGYLLDCAAFPYAKPSGYLRVDWRGVESFEDNIPDYGIIPGCELLFMVACSRRGGIMCACMVAMAWAL